ncbi:DUF2484 family protein [Lentibacter algarum]|uniref:DUF2484 family protein n=1 Tax=Lentibacter algarum TaxID=576131 RepID=UPI001C088C00|nr:DUF2484 family protein [Lentibacter algarum]
MSTPLWLGILWVFAATATAFLRIGKQYVPAVILLVAAPFIIVWIGYVHGWIFSGLAFAGFISMFRNPLRFIWRKYVRGEDLELPE